MTSSTSGSSYTTPGQQRPRERWPARLPAPGTVYALVVVLATLIVATCAVNALHRLGTPFSGFFLWSNLFVPAVGESSWTGVSSGLRYHSWLISVDGEEVEDAREVAAKIADLRPGEKADYELEKDGERYTITTEVMILGPRAWSSVLGIYLFDAIVLLLLGVVLLWMKPTDSAARALFLFSTNLALYMATSTDIFGPYWFRVAYFFFVNLVSPSVLNLLSRFPVGRTRGAWEDRALRALTAFALIYAAASNLAFQRSRAWLLWLDGLSHAMMAAAGLAAIVFFLAHFVRARTRVVRNRTKIVLAGTIGAFTPPVVMLAAVYGAGVPFAFNFLTMLFVLFPISIGYAIARHDLFDIDRAIKRTLVYVTLSAFVFSIYTVAITGVDYLFENLTQVASRIAEGVLILFLILITSPSRRRIQDIVDRLYDRRRYNYRDVIRSVAQTFTRILDFDDLVRRVLRLLDETMQPELVRVYTVGNSTMALLHGQVDHRQDGNGDLRADIEGTPDPVVAPLVEHLCTGELVTAEDDATSARGHDAARALREVGGSLAVPMRLSGALSGMVIVGARRAGGHYGGDDVELLRTVSDQLAVALDNARAYKTIDRLNRNLGIKNVALEEANRDLCEAQDELVQKERLAAIGELSAAVAHAMRNPLAGIKAAAQLALFELSSHPAESTVADVVSETDRLTDRIAALLDFSKPFEPAVRRVSLRAIADGAVRDTKSKAEGAGVSLEVEISAELPDVDVDPVLFEQAAIELISNAVDASPPASAVTVRTGSETDGGSAVAWLEVEDSGAGINEAAKERLFELFYTTKPKGTGFGLATVKKIVERHGGQVIAGSGASGGARFRLILPAAEPKPSSA